MSQKSETKASVDLYKPLVRRGWWIRKLHGNVYQAGLLDYQLCRLSDGVLMNIEMKNTKVSRKYYCQADILAKLVGAQIGTFKQLVHLNARAAVVLTAPEGVYFVKPPLTLNAQVHPITNAEFYKALERW